MNKLVCVFTWLCLLLTATLLAGCEPKRQHFDPDAFIADVVARKLTPYPVSSEPLPADLNWQTNDSDPIFADPNAKRGGVYREYIPSFPLTLRLVGPDSNGAFAGYTRALALSLLDVHPNTLNPIPALATHWALGYDGKTAYFKLDPDARWSDGKAVTADDFVYTLEFMRAKEIVSPFYNDYYSTQLSEVLKFDDHTIAVRAANPKPAEELLLEHVNLRPVPRHFHQLDTNWVRNYNWLPEPGTGAYVIDRVRKGKFVEFKRLDNWWGNDKRYFQHRFNADKVHVKVVRDNNVAWQYFEKGELDSFSLTQPDFWHERAQGDLFQHGYIEKVWFYNDIPQSAQGLWLNVNSAPLDDVRVRLAFAHAINADKVINTLLRGDYQRLETHNVGYGDYDNTAIKPRAFDLARAVALLEAAGWTELGPDAIRRKNGERLSLAISYGRGDLTDRLVILKEEAKKAGIELQLQLLDSSAFIKKVLEKNHQVALLGWASGGFSPEYWQFYHSDNANKPQTNNITNFADPTMDQLIDAYRAELDKSRRVAMAHKMEQIIFDAGVFVPLFKVPYTREAHWAWIKLPQQLGTRTSGNLTDALNAGLFWIDTDLKNDIRSLRRQHTALQAPVTVVDETWRRTVEAAP